MTERLEEDVNDPIAIGDAELTVEIMKGETMELILKGMQGMKHGWLDTNQSEQESIIQAVEMQADSLIERMVRLVTAANRTTLKGHLVDVKKGKKEITAKLEFPLNDPDQTELFQFANEHVMVTLINSADFIDPDTLLPQANKDQRDLPLSTFE